jgi:mRNA-degrading endonuclease RelE of RelBE toxin-antitoxin system
MNLSSGRCSKIRTGSASSCIRRLLTATARRGTYRVINRVGDQQLTVTVLTLTHRRDAYRR